MIDMEVDEPAWLAAEHEAVAHADEPVEHSTVTRLARAVARYLDASDDDRPGALMVMVGAAEPLLRYADVDHAAHQLEQYLTEVRDGTYDPTEDPGTVAAFYARQIRYDANQRPPAAAEELETFLPPDLLEFCDVDEPPYQWLIPGLIERGDRIIVTGIEGQGKSTLLRQIAVQAASGIHPFTLAAIDPLRVLVVDCENSERQTRRALRPLRDAAGAAYRSGALRVHVVTDALELAREPVYNALALRIHAHQPELIVIGPIYKMTIGDPTKEEPAKALAVALDRLRHLCGSALIAEAHSPYQESAKVKRTLRPYGASLWSRWPEFGLYIAPDGKLEHWRGPRDEREWPAALQRGTPWPWMPGAAKGTTDEWDGPTECMAAVAAYLANHPGEFTKTALPPKLRAIGLHYRDKTVHTALETLAARGEIALRKAGRNAEFYSVLGDRHETGMEF